MTYQFTKQDRTWVVTQDQREFKNLKAHLLEQGFDGNVYYGKSEPTGRQRVAYQGMFYRSANTGDFVQVA
jgi:hypothetical protein